MKKVIVSFALLFATASVFAACPIHAPYGCQQMPNGKMLCGCGR